MNTPINGNDLLALGYAEGTILGIALKINRGRNGFTREQMISHYKAILENPENYMDDKIFGKLAIALIEKSNEKPEDFIQLNQNPDAFSAYGLEHIEQGAIQQMKVAMQLPVTVAGALMPDAHQGYGLPIGGVLATKMPLFRMALAWILVAEWRYPFMIFQRIFTLKTKPNLKENWSRILNLVRVMDFMDNTNHTIRF